MKKFSVVFFVAGFLSFLLINCSGGKQNTPDTLSLEEVQEIQHLDSISAEIESSMEELETTEAELMKALEEIEQ